MEITKGMVKTKTHHVADILPGCVFYHGGKYYIKMKKNVGFSAFSSGAFGFVFNKNLYDDPQFTYDIEADCLCVWKGAQVIEDAPVSCKITLVE